MRPAYCDVRWHTDALMALARRRSGLGDFGDTVVRRSAAPAARLLHRRGIAQPGRAHGATLGRRAVPHQPAAVPHAERRDPGILNQTIERPIFITGLPRSGTTFLHRLLMEDPDNRAPLRLADDISVSAARSRRATGAIRGRCASRGNCAPSKGWHPSSARCIRSMRPRRRSAARSPRMCSAACASTRRIGYRPTGAGWMSAGICRPIGSTSASCSTCSIRTAGGRWVVKCPEHLFALMPSARSTRCAAGVRAS